MSRSAPALLMALCLLTTAARADDLTELSLEELTELEVTSVARTSESLGGAAAAVTVISNEELRRRGVTSIPEALRYAPGLHVAHLSSSSWAVGARGFGGPQSNKLLVLVDTRSIYTPLFSGVLWDVQDLLFEDVERIEVVRGPGASLWGANAVNGVINIIPRSVKETQGLYFEAGGGDELRGYGAVRYGAAVTDDLHVRAFSKYFNRDGSAAATGEPLPDEAWMATLGLRGDWEATSRDSITFEAKAYRSDIGQVEPSVTIIGRPGPTGPLIIDARGGHVLGRWRHTLDESSELQLRAYYDYTRRDDPTFFDELHTLDVELQHRVALPLDQELLWGLAYRLTSNRNEGKGIFAVDPPSSVDNLFSGFIQDRIELPGAVRLTVGTKLEHNDFSGFEVQPTVRAAWEPGAGHTVWGAVSRAVRVPTRLERDVAIYAADPAGPVVPQLLGNPAFGSEELIAYELGYRWQGDFVRFDVAAFHNRYRGLASLEAGEPFQDDEGRTIVPITHENLTDGRATGGELSVTASLSRAWRMTASYWNTLMHVEPRGEDLNRSAFLAGATPRQQLVLRSSMDVTETLQIDGGLRYVGAVRRTPELPGGEGSAEYTELDLRVAWEVARGLEVSLTGRNLLHERHREFPLRPLAERSVYFKVAGRY